MKRSAGILLSISSLPSKYGIGCFSESAYKFVDFLKASGQTYWQILPLGATSYGDSPYQSFSTFAGNPYFIDIDEFVKSGLLTQEECENTDFGNDERNIDYEKQYFNRYPLLKKAFERSDIVNSYDFKQFCDENPWLDDYALFMAIKDNYKGISWIEWDEEIRLRNPDAMEKYRSELEYEISFYKFLQFVFFNQWGRLKKYANENGIEIIGDIPIYVAFDSADTWSAPKLFCLDENNVPTAVAGCPPDGFSADGQLWGNPLYNWDVHKSSGYEWWISRMAQCFKMYDVVRIDHFRGFDEYYSIPYGDKNAKNGHWEKGAGIQLFKAISDALGTKKIIAEDLGFMTDTVRELVKACGFPNMKVLEFAFDSRDTGSRNDYLPHNYNENCVAYTGTHDNQTIVSWLKTITDEEFAMVREYLYDTFTPDDKLYKSLIALVMRSKADVCIIPMQDWLGLDDSCRMNTPSTVGDNWKWRMTESDMNNTLSSEIYNMTKIYDR